MKSPFTITSATSLMLMVILAGCNHNKASTNTPSPMTNTHNTPSASKPASMDESTPSPRLGVVNGKVELAGGCGNIPTMPHASGNACNAKPFSTKISIFRVSDSALHTSLSSNDTGSFSIQLPPNTYRFVIDKTPFTSGASQQVNVLPETESAVLLTVNAQVP